MHLAPHTTPLDLEVQKEAQQASFILLLSLTPKLDTLCMASPSFSEAVESVFVAHQGGLGR